VRSGIPEEALYLTHVPLSQSTSAIGRFPALVVTESEAILRHLRLSWRVLWALTVIESRRKYAGSILGMLWYPLYSALLLGCYCFVYMVIFHSRFKELGTYDYVLFVFAGLIPFLGLSEAVSTSTPSVRQSIAILRNAVFPIEFVPVKSVGAALFGLTSSLAILIAMTLPTSRAGWHFLYLPVAVVALAMFCVTIGWILSATAVVIPDLVQVVNIALMLLMFVSPVGYGVADVPARVRFLLFLNPLTYLIDMFRFAVLGMRDLPLWVHPVFVGLTLAGAAVAGTFFRIVSPVFADYE
jgi:homopolymeric O-antigen transport system permease protein